MRLLRTLPLLLALAVPVAAQPATQAVDLDPVPSIAVNGVGELAARGDSLWVGPRLNLTYDGGTTWYAADADSLTAGRVFSLDLAGDVIWAGLGRIATDNNGNPLRAPVGYVYSTDGGDTWTYRRPFTDAPNDTLIAYGDLVLPAVPLAQTQTYLRSAPFGLDYDARTGRVWSANWFGGLRYSDDDGRTWTRTVLPPDTLSFLSPETIRAPFRVGFPSPYTDAAVDRYDNYLAFTVLVDEAGVVWAGTGGGLNRSEDDGTSWRRFTNESSPGSLLGNWVIALAEQPVADGRNAIWISSRRGPTSVNPLERAGVTVTRDGGETFEQVLLGEGINAFAFAPGVVYAAGDGGLFISEDDGLTWRTVRDFGNGAPVGLTASAVATTRDAVWVGTTEGLFRSTDRGVTWRQYRADVPLHPATPTADVPDVDTYAYPNPFSPLLDGVVRIKYELERAGDAEVRIFDFSMNLVRRLAADGSAGTNEVTWDGATDAGLRTANGAYLYSVRTDAGTVWGKILLVE